MHFDFNNTFTFMHDKSMCFKWNSRNYKFIYQFYTIVYNSTFSLIGWCNEIYLQVWVILHVLPDWKRQRALNWIHSDNEYPNKIELFCIQNLVEI